MRAAGSTPARRHRASPFLAVVICLALVAAWLARLDIGYEAQIVVAAALVAVMVVMKPMRPTGLARLLFLTIGLFVTTRYILWRTFHTVPDIDAPGFVPGLLIYLAELYAFCLMLLGLFISIEPLRRPVVLPDGPPAAWPTVDIFVPTYDEAPEIVEATMMAATQVEYPAGRLRVYLLDDGGTEQKLADRDPVKAAHAAERAARLREICVRQGVTYLTRARNEMAKAGNLNAALPSTSGELILVLDADHVPSEDFLVNTVGPFQRDPKLFLVQTPHFFISPDPVERNLSTFGQMPGEPEMFYRVIQHGLDYWNASFFCGSAAVLRRRCIEEIGGFSGVSITEDVETALELHARGYNSAYIDRPMVAGLSPETFSGFAVQRTRWCQGMTQVLLLKRPMFKRGLSMAQRIAYTACASFWLFGAARLVFYVSPLWYLFFGLSIYDADAWGFAAYTVPHLVAMILVSNVMHGSVRWPFISELYETIQSPSVVPAMLKVLRSPRRPTFMVTPKGETVGHAYLSPLSWPFVTMWLLLLAGFAAGAFRYWAFPEQRPAGLLVCFWNLINFAVIGAALGVVLEHIQNRQWPRMPMSKPARLRIGDLAGDGMIEDLSVGGARLALHDPAPLSQLRLPATGTLEVELPRHGLAALPIAILRRDEQQGEALHCRFVGRTSSERERIVELFYGSSTPWIAFLGHHRRAPGVVLGTWLFIRLSLRYMATAVFFLLRRRRSAELPAAAPAERPRIPAQASLP